MFVKPDGKFYACEKLGYTPFEVGNVYDGFDEKRVFELLDFITAQANSKCSECWAANLCDICTMCDSNKVGVIDMGRREEKCVEKREAITNYLGMYVELCQTLGQLFYSHARKLKGGSEKIR